nr:MAG TPA: hypothetical protein [Crassvirales sp.]
MHFLHVVGQRRSNVLTLFLRPLFIIEIFLFYK